MSKCLQREPIHPRIANKGKLRKVQHQKLQTYQPFSQMLLTPMHVLDAKLARRNKLHCFFRKQQHPTFVFSGLPTPGEQASGSFRAIHTAHPEDSIRGFPLRSITPIRPFRRGIRSTSSIYPDQKRGLSEQYKNLSEIMGKRPPSLLENEEIEEFFKYKEGDREGERKVAGSRIEPFRKYQIRDVSRGPLSQRSQLAQL